MNKLAFNAISSGLISSTLGSIFISMIINSQINKSKDKLWIKDKMKILRKFKILEVMLFMMGVITHLLLEYFDFDKWYCEKVCIGDTCTTKCVYKPNKVVSA